MKTFPQPAINVDNGADDIRMTFYVSDASSGKVPRVILHYLSNGQQVRESDHALSEYTTLTPVQKTNFRAMVLTIRDETFTLDGAT